MKGNCQTKIRQRSRISIIPASVTPYYADGSLLFAHCPACSCRLAVPLAAVERRRRTSQFQKQSSALWYRAELLQASRGEI